MKGANNFHKNRLFISYPLVSRPKTDICFVMKDQTTFVILLAGELNSNARLRNLCQSARIIAADGGIRYAEKLDITPELWVGDFDSATPQMIKQYDHVKKLSFDRQKDATDGSLAIKSAIERGAETIILAGAIGGDRFDHSLALMLEMVAHYENGIDIYMTTGLEECRPLGPGRLHLKLEDGALFSILPLSDLSDLSIENAKYPLEKIAVSFGSTHTMSNVALGDVTIDLGSGRAVVIARPDDFSGI